MEIRAAIERTFISFIRMVDVNRHTYCGTPVEMMDALEGAINKSISDYNDSLRP